MGVCGGRDRLRGARRRRRLGVRAPPAPLGVWGWGCRTGGTAGIGNGLGGNGFGRSSAPTSCNGQGHVPLDQLAPNPIHSGPGRFRHGAATASVGNLCQGLTTGVFKFFSQSCSSSPAWIDPRTHLASSAASALGLTILQRFPWPRFSCPALFEDSRQINPSTGIKKANAWSRVVPQHHHPAAPQPLSGARAS